ncbi:F-box/FBD/LRR-repeat protein At1g78750-like [Curcuma longa]|uniref:F-box/FBD/LRR-repeat protein At1g78750-like n=1 Tax=Curcuma longa TaxID=136217 RepID=UPI003D9E8C08
MEKHYINLSFLEKLGREEDYISSLPDGLLYHILSFLPTLDSIRTSLLSRRWRRLWASVPAIVFFSVDHSSANAIDHFLASRSGSCSISHLRLFKIELEAGGTLVRDLLYLRQISRRPRYPKRIILSNLKTLSLIVEFAEISATNLARLLSCCPVLEELTLKALYQWNCSIEIAAPNLRRLTLRIICPKLGFLKLAARHRLKRLHLEAPSLTLIRMRCLLGWIKLSRRFCDVNEEAASVGDLHLQEFSLTRLVCYDLFLV